MNLNYGSGSPDGTFLPGATTPNVSVMYVNSVPNGDSTFAGSFATLGPFAGGADQGNPALPFGSYDANVDKPPTVNASATFNAADGESSTEVYVTTLVTAAHEQQGAPALNASSQVVLAGVTNLSINNWYAGSYGTTGNKFS